MLFNRTNSYQFVGRTGIYYEHGTEQIFASYLVRFVCDKQQILPEYLTAYLNTKYGINEIKRRARQSINQTNVNPEEVKLIELPLLSKDLQQKIADRFRQADTLITQARRLYREAESILERELGLDRFTPSTCGIAVKSFSESFGASGRLDAEYYQPKYEDCKKFISSRETVGSICKIRDDNFNPIKDKTYRYIELSNVGACGEIGGTEEIRGSELPTRARRLVRAGQLIVSSIEGSLQSCALITDEYDCALCSTGFYVIESTECNSETLLMLFKTELMQMLMKQGCSGTILTAISKEQFLNLPLPLVSLEVQSAIADRVQQSFALRRQSKQLLERAKSAVELAIERDEQTAIHALST